MRICLSKGPLPHCKIMILTSYLLVVNTVCVFEYLYVSRNVLGTGVGWSSEFISNLEKAVWEVIRVRDL